MHPFDHLHNIREMLSHRLADLRDLGALHQLALSPVHRLQGKHVDRGYKAPIQERARYGSRLVAVTAPNVDQDHLLPSSWD